jgi:hypothetical protein
MSEARRPGPPPGTEKPHPSAAGSTTTRPPPGQQKNGGDLKRPAPVPAARSPVQKKPPAAAKSARRRAASGPGVLRTIWLAVIGVWFRIWSPIADTKFGDFFKNIFTGRFLPVVVAILGETAVHLVALQMFMHIFYEDDFWSASIWFKFGQLMRWTGIPGSLITVVLMAITVWFFSCLRVIRTTRNWKDAVPLAPVLGMLSDLWRVFIARVAGAVVAAAVVGAAHSVLASDELLRDHEDRVDLSMNSEFGTTGYGVVTQVTLAAVHQSTIEELVEILRARAPEEYNLYVDNPKASAAFDNLKYLGRMLDNKRKTGVDVGPEYMKSIAARMQVILDNQAASGKGFDFTDDDIEKSETFCQFFEHLDALIGAVSDRTVFPYLPPAKWEVDLATFLFVRKEPIPFQVLEDLIEWVQEIDYAAEYGELLVELAMSNTERRIMDTIAKLAIQNQQNSAAVRSSLATISDNLGTLGAKYDETAESMASDLTLIREQMAALSLTVNEMEVIQRSSGAVPSTIVAAEENSESLIVGEALEIEPAETDIAVAVSDEPAEEDPFSSAPLSSTVVAVPPGAFKPMDRERMAFSDIHWAKGFKNKIDGYLSSPSTDVELENEFITVSGADNGVALVIINLRDTDTFSLGAGPTLECLVKTEDGVERLDDMSGRLSRVKFQTDSDIVDKHFIIVISGGSCDVPQETGVTVCGMKVHVMNEDKGDFGINESQFTHPSEGPIKFLIEMFNS